MFSTKSEPASAGAGPTRPWPADQVERWPIERLIPYANNARLHSEADLDKLAAAIRKWGWTMPVLVDEEGVLLAGHVRVGAAAKLGLTSIPVIVARGWSEEEKRAYRLADNQLAARASWDPELLRNELQAARVRRFRCRSDRLRAGSARNHPGRFGIERSDRSRQRSGDTRSTGHSGWRHVAAGRPPGWLRRQHQRGGCRASAGRIAASPDDRRSALRGQLRAVLASAP